MFDGFGGSDPPQAGPLGESLSAVLRRHLGASLVPRSAWRSCRPPSSLGASSSSLGQRPCRVRPSSEDYVNRWREGSILNEMEERSQRAASLRLLDEGVPAPVSGDPAVRGAHHQRSCGQPCIDRRRNRPRQGIGRCGTLPPSAAVRRFLPPLVGEVGAVQFVGAQAPARHRPVHDLLETLIVARLDEVDHLVDDDVLEARRGLPWPVRS